LSSDLATIEEFVGEVTRLGDEIQPAVIDEITGEFTRAWTCRL